MLAQEAGAEAVESAEGCSSRDLHGQEAGPHFLGRLVGEGQGQNRPGGDAAGDEVGDPMGDDPGFSRAGAGQDQHRSFPVRSRRPLAFGQAG